MWMLSGQAQVLVRQLYEVRSSTWRLLRPSREERIIAILERLKEHGELAAAVSVAGCLFESSERIKTTASRTLYHLLSLVSPDQLIHLSGGIGWSWGHYISDDWEKLKPHGVSALLVDPQSRTAVLGLLSFHRSGYVRQEAVRLLDRQGTGEELPYLLIRQNDWVGVIVDEAQRAVNKRLVPSYLPHFVRTLPLVVHLLKFTRHDLSPVVRKVVEMLAQPQYDAVLAEAINTSSLQVRREIVRVAVDLPREYRARAIRHGLSSTDAIIRLTCAKRVAESFSGTELQQVTTRLQLDRFMPARREGFRLEAEGNPVAASTIWERALLDPHASIRELARYSLGRIGAFDPAAFYRRMIAEKGLSPPAASGLAESGDQGDVETLRNLLLHPQPSFRLIAVRGVARIAGKGAADDLLRSLRDGSPSVVREAKRRLEPFASEVRSEDLFAIVNQADSEHAKRCAVELIFDKGKWQSLPWLIQIAMSPHEAAASLARRLTEAWFSPPLCNRVFTRPTSDQREAIDEVMEQLRKKPNDPFLVKLEAWLRAA